MNDTTTKSRAEASALLAPVFLEILCEEGVDFESFEGRAISVGHAVIAEAMSIAIERLDARLCADLPEGCRVHDRRSKTLATEVGDLTFTYRRVRDAFGNTVVPYADALDLPWGARVSPAARSFLVEAGAEVSYQRAANLLARNGSRVSATTVMNAVRRAGELCAEEDAALAEELFANGVVPRADVDSPQLLVEADGTWIRLQNAGEGPKRVEVKALVAYGSKAKEGGRTRRVDAVHHGCVASPDAFWTQGIAAIGTRFDLSKVETCHLGTDGEGWCKRGAEFLPSRIETTGHIDPFHVSHAVLSCFGGDGARAAWHVLDVANDGDADAAACLLEAMRDAGMARAGKHTDRVIGYLRNNAGLIAAEGPSLGTMESENQHLYGARMDSVPCAWSSEGASAMARLISRRASKREIPRLTRELSVTRRRARRREERVAKALYPKGAGKVVESVGSGYLPPHQASVASMSAKVRHAANVDWGMPLMQG